MGEFSTFEEVLKRDGKLVYKNRGDSMWPFIREGRDLLLIIPAERPLKKYDIPLYRRDNGQYILHRIIGRDESGYIMRGDNRSVKEYGITDGHIIGVLYAVLREEKEIPADSFASRIKLCVWRFVYPFHRLGHKGKKWFLRRKNQTRE
ncbi:MAG: S24/S26 family peptidase [Lachnospiraceae bacterium]|nr:S24/S26 family peptidase [Lachnospiraceae bacterium]